MEAQKLSKKSGPKMEAQKLSKKKWFPKWKPKNFPKKSGSQSPKKVPKLINFVICKKGQESTKVIPYYSILA